MDAEIADVDDRNVAEDWRGFGLEMASAISISLRGPESTTTHCTRSRFTR